jgi:hypothetical protein
MCLATGPGWVAADDRPDSGRNGPALEGPHASPAGASLLIMTGMGRTGGSRAARRRRLMAALVVFAMVLAAGATVLSLALG